jgi:phage FluMu protein gp41
MNKRQLLFVTYQDGNLDEGLSYAIELAKAMAEDIVLLTVRKKDTLARKFEDLMAGVAFAEAGEHESARELAAPETAAPIDHNGKITELVVRASKAGVLLSAENTDQDVVAGIKSFVKQNAGVDKVVLSPTVTESEILTTRDLNRLVRTASRPIVTMTRQAVLHSTNSVQKRSVA